MNRRRPIGRSAALALAQVLADEPRLDGLDQLIDFVAFRVGLPRKCVRLRNGSVRPELVTTFQVVAETLSRRVANRTGA